MNHGRVRFLVLTVCLLLALTTTVAGLAQSEMLKDYMEGKAGMQSGEVAANGVSTVRPYVEGEAGITSQGLDSIALNGVTLRYVFSGVSDDGAKGVNGTKATSIHCTNTGATSAVIQAELYSFSGILVESRSVLALSGSTYTFSTQQTAIYFDDVDFAADAIVQGYGRILSDSAAVICSAQVLDPLNWRPVFISALEIYRP